MPKREFPDKKSYDMSEREATREYLKILNQIRKEKGSLAATGYEIKSTLYSLGNRIWHTLAMLRSGAELVAEDGAFGLTPRPSRADNPAAHYRREDIEGYPDYVKAKRKAYILRGKKDNNLETAAITSIIGIVGGIFFLSPNLTGNVIGNITNPTSNIIGVTLLIVGLIGSFFWFRSRR
ncbi:MAG: hypothetical protein Q8N63_03405 [Nanoarchaeota archaeon]|nr:hypothetical protein [Nanoarchaeota archaeon]